MSERDKFFQCVADLAREESARESILEDRVEHLESLLLDCFNAAKSSRARDRKPPSTADLTAVPGFVRDRINDLSQDGGTQKHNPTRSTR